MVLQVSLTLVEDRRLLIDPSSAILRGLLVGTRNLQEIEAG